MCQLGAVVANAGRVFQKTGVFSHAALHVLATERWPDEQFADYEYDFAERAWQGWERIPSEHRVVLVPFANELWGDADKVIQFVSSNGAPNNCLIAPAERAYWEACAAAKGAYEEACAAAERAYQEVRAAAKGAYWEACAAAERAYQEVRAPAKGAYWEACAAAWIRLFAETANRIPIWRETI